MSKCHIVGNHMSRLINSMYPVVGHGLLINPYMTGNPYTGTMTNREDPDDKASFHKGLHCLLRKIRSRKKKYIFHILACNPAIYNGPS